MNLYFSSYTPLLYAVQYEDVQMINFLINYGADVNMRSKFGTTPLMATFLNKDASIAKILIDHGANINDKGNNGVSILVSVIIYDNMIMVRFLLDHGAKFLIDSNANLYNTCDKMLLYHSKSQEVMKLLFHYQNVNHQDYCDHGQVVHYNENAGVFDEGIQFHTDL